MPFFPSFTPPQTCLPLGHLPQHCWAIFPNTAGPSSPALLPHFANTSPMGKGSTGTHPAIECGHPGCRETKGTRWKGGHCKEHRAGEPSDIAAKRSNHRLDVRLSYEPQTSRQPRGSSTDGSRSTIDRQGQVRELCTDSSHYEELRRNSWRGLWRGQKVTFNGAVDATPENTLVWQAKSKSAHCQWRPYQPDDHWLVCATKTFLQDPPQVPWPP